MRAVLLATLLLSTASCSLVLPADAVQCETTEDCIARGFPSGASCELQVCVEPTVDPVGGCLGKVEEPMPVGGATHPQSILFVDRITGEPPPELTARLCAAVDVTCESPLQEGSY